MARRLIEAGVRCVEVSAGAWEQRRNLCAAHPRISPAVDRPIVGLLADPKSRGLLRETLEVRSGKLDEEAVKNKVHVHDRHATLFYLRGLDHERLTVRCAGRPVRLTEASSRVMHEVIG